MNLVLDTDVVVSGFLNPHGIPGQFLYRVTQGDWTVLYDVRILDEYRSVLSRPEFNLPVDSVELFMREMEEDGRLIIPRPLKHRLPDFDDEVFLEVAIGGNGDFLVTGNLKHFPASARQGICVLSPTDFYNKVRR